MTLTLNLPAPLSRGCPKHLNGANVIQKNTTIKENVVTTILDNTILAKEGIVRAEFSIVKNDMVVTTFTILLEVEPSIDRNNAMTKQPEWDILVDLRKELEEAIELTPNWLYGDSVPAKENGDRNDYYLKRGNGEVFHRDSETDTWKSTNIFLKGCQWHYGKEATPVDTLGNNGDYYINTDNYDFFNKASGKWVKIGNIKGIDGNREILVQPEMPTDQQVGHIWIDTDS